MTATAFDTLKAAKALKDAGFNEAQAEAVVATVGDAVGANIATITDEIASVADKMATKEQLASVADKMATKEQLASAVDKMATEERFNAALDKMATKEYFASMIAELRAEIAVEFKGLYRHLWLMAASIVGVTVALGKLIP